MSAYVPPRLVCIVEGHGEVEAVPILVRRIAMEVASIHIDCPRPIWTHRDQLIRQPRELERVIKIARSRIDENGAILILIDSEGALPCVLGPDLLHRARPIAGSLEVGVVVAHRKYEAWFLAAAESLRGLRGLSGDLTGPADPEMVGDAKRWLREQMPRGQTYHETIHQPALTQFFDLQAARRAPSFDKCYREVERLVRTLIDPPTSIESVG